MWRTVTQRGGGRTASGHRRGMRNAHLLRQGSAGPSARRNARRGRDAHMTRHAAVIGGQDAKNPPLTAFIAVLPYGTELRRRGEQTGRQ